MATRLQAALLALLDDDATLAHQVLEEWDRVQHIERHIGWLGLTCLVGFMGTRVGTDDQMERHLRVIEPFHDQIGSTGAFWVGSVAGYAGVLCAASGETKTPCATSARLWTGTLRSARRSSSPGPSGLGPPAARSGRRR